MAGVREWERREGEPEKAYGHFTAWLAHIAEGGRRQLREYAKARGISESLARRLSSRHQWFARTDAYIASDPSLMAIDPATTDIIPATTPPEVVEQLAVDRAGLAQRRLALAERRTDLAERAADIASDSLNALQTLRGLYGADPEVHVKVLNVTAKMINDALPKEVIIETGDMAGDLTDHPQWPAFADAMVRALQPFPDALDALAELWREMAQPDVVDGEVVPT